MRDKVSIAVANFNNSKFLSELIKSIENQACNDWELIITDDCSTDNSVDILKSICCNEKMKFFVNKQNMGVGPTFKNSVDCGKGNLVILVGADDSLEPFAVESIINAHKQAPRASLIVHPILPCDSKMRIKSEDLLFSFDATKSLIHQPGASFIETFTRCSYQKTDGISIELPAAIDQDLRLKLEEVGEVVASIVPFYRYRMHA